MRKQSSSDISSFEMLLDTMCNTFGGIVFIALLVAIISSSTNQQTAKDSLDNNKNFKEIEQNIEMNRLIHEQQDLKTGICHLQDTLVKTNALPSIPTNTMASLISSNIMLRAELNSLETTNASISAAISSLLYSHETNIPTKAELDAQIKQLRDELRRKREQATRIVRLPMERVVKDKQPVFFAVRDKKFYAISDVSVKQPSRKERNYDTKEVNIESGPGMVVGELRKNAGQLIRPGCERAGKLARALANLNSKTEFISFSVHTNSFAEFNYVKALLVQRGFAYNWSIAEGAISIIRADEVTTQ